MSWTISVLSRTKNILSEQKDEAKAYVHFYAKRNNFYSSEIFCQLMPRPSARTKYFLSLTKSHETFCFYAQNTFMPRPSAWTNYFLSWTKLKLSKIKILSRVKKYIFCFQKSFKTKFPDWKSIFNNKYSFCMTFESKKCSF